MKLNLLARYLTSLLWLLAANPGCAIRHHSPFENSSETIDDGGKSVTSTESAIDVREVPPRIIATARELVPGFKIREAEREVEGAEVSYSLEGKAHGKKIEVELEEPGFWGRDRG